VFVAGRRRGLGIGLVTVGIVALSALSACSSAGSAPQTLPRLSTTPATVTSTAPPTTKAAELAAVKAVVRRYYALLNAPTTVANADALAAMLTRDCTCRRVVRSMRQMAASGRQYFGRSSLVSLRPYIDSPTEADVYVEYNYSSGGYKDAAGRVLHSEPGRTGVKVDFRLTPVGGRWIISRIDLISEGSK
jgi:hypothetical protein